MAGGERRRFVEEEELGEASGLQQRTALPAAELEPARDPAPAVVAAADAPFVVVEAATVPVDQAARGVCDELAQRCDPVLQRHPGIIANAESPRETWNNWVCPLVEKKDVDVTARGRSPDRPQRRGALRVARGVRGVHEHDAERSDACRPRALRGGGVVERSSGRGDQPPRAFVRGVLVGRGSAERGPARPQACGRPRGSRALRRRPRVVRQRRAPARGTAGVRRARCPDADARNQSTLCRR